MVSSCPCQHSWGLSRTRFFSKFDLYIFCKCLARQNSMYFYLIFFVIFLSADFERPWRGFPCWQQIQLGRCTTFRSYFNGRRTQCFCSLGLPSAKGSVLTSTQNLGGKWVKTKNETKCACRSISEGTQQDCFKKSLFYSLCNFLLLTL